MLQGCVAALSLSNLICSLLIKCVSAFHSMWGVVESVRMRHSLRWSTSSLFSDEKFAFLLAVQPDSKVQMHLFVKRFCNLKHNNFNKRFFLVLIKLFWSCAQSCSLTTILGLFEFWLHSRGRIRSEQREIGCRCQEPIYSTSPSVRHGYLFICSFFFLPLFVLHTTNNFPCELEAGIDQVQGRLCALHCAPFPTLSCKSKIQKMSTQTCK